MIIWINTFWDHQSICSDMFPLKMVSLIHIKPISSLRQLLQRDITDGIFKGSGFITNVLCLKDIEICLILLR